jgi:hypothetical protein
MCTEREKESRDGSPERTNRSNGNSGKYLWPLKGPFSKNIKAGEVAALSEPMARLIVVCFRSILFDPEEGGNVFLRNVGKLLSDYTASHHRCENIKSHM